MPVNKKYHISWWRTELGKKAIVKVKESILNRHISQGPITEKFESRLGKLLDVPYVVLTTSGSTALLMALIACGVKTKDEVIIPNRTFIATANAPLLLGAKVKLVDVEFPRQVIDLKKLNKAITPRTKVIIPVHLNGRAADIKGIHKLAAKYGIKVIEDATQALCSRNHFGYLGTQSDMGVFSLAMTKLITTGQGGFVITRNKETFKKLQKIKNQGVSPGWGRNHDVLGLNFKFNDILAAIGLSQLERIEGNVAALKNVYDYYNKALDELEFIKIIDVDVKRGELPLWTEVLCVERDKLVELLRRKKIQALPLSPSICEIRHLKTQNDFKYSKIYSKYGLILPCGPDQRSRDLKSTIRAIKAMRGKFKTNIKKKIMGHSYGWSNFQPK